MVISPSATSATPPSSTPVVTVDRLRKTYGATVAVEDVSLTVREGEVLGIIGPNGAGKTTTVECISGLRAPDSGEIRVFGLDPRRDRRRIREMVGVQLQEGAVPPNVRVGEAVELFASFYRSPAKTDELLHDVGLTDKRHEAYHRLSGGLKQRLSIALALVGNPRLAILDELTTGLDPQARRETWSFIEKVRARGVTVILVTHFMDEVERLCDRVVLVNGGKVVTTGTPAELAAREGGDVHIRFVPSGPLDDAILSAIPGVANVTHEGLHLVVTGSAAVPTPLLKVLADLGVEARDLQVRTGNLDDAFVRLTARRPPETVGKGNS
ncbi:MAG: ABC transporter ATP-binding protein [Thermoplasmata archaeon]|jgi:ABC-2 type transport system ATP-binding protein|nr:ABC transporter ATP-binding protein [Thermoplasmata archaeon]